MGNTRSELKNCNNDQELNNEDELSLHQDKNTLEIKEEFKRNRSA